MQCLVYACQIEPALPEEEAVGLAKLLLGMADGLQGLSQPHFDFCLTWSKCYYACVLHATHYRLLFVLARSAQMHTIAADVADPHRVWHPCFAAIMHSLCQLY